jgi:hypothetical protein
MAYAMRYNESRRYDVLIETTPAKIKADEKLLRVCARVAHNWVKRGRIHETTLWVNEDGRIRKA